MAGGDRDRPGHGGLCSILRVITPTIAHFESLIDRLAPFGRPSSMMVLSTALRWKPVTVPAVTADE